jgi:hypothetical protein
MGRKKKETGLLLAHLEALEKEAVLNLTHGLSVEKDNTAWVRLALDFLKAKHPAYRDKKDQILPQDYENMWKEIISEPETKNKDIQ